MAMTLQLTDGTTTLDLLTATDYLTLMAGISTPPPPHEITFAGSRGSDGTYPAFSHRGNREITLRLRIEGTSIDDLLTNVSAADKLLAEGTRYWRTGGREGKRARLTVKPDGATNTVEYVVLAGRIDLGNWPDLGMRNAYKIAGATIALTCSPFAQETSNVTSTSNNQANDGIAITLSSVRGEVETPAKIVIGTDQSLVSARCIVGRRTRGTVGNFVRKYQCETGTYTGYTVTDLAGGGWTYAEGSDAAYSGGKYGGWTRASTVTDERFMRVAITANLSDHYGKFRLLAFAALGYAEVNLRAYYGTQTTPTKSTGVAITSIITPRCMYDLGIIDWPDRALPADVTASTLVIELMADTGSMGSAVNKFDYLLLVPVDESYIDIDFGSTLASGDKVVIDGTAFPPRVYVTDGSDNVKTSTVITSVTGTFLTIAPGTNVFYVYLDNDVGATLVGDVLADTADVVITYRPRYHQWRGT